MWTSNPLPLCGNAWVGVGSPIGEFSAWFRDSDPDRRVARAWRARRALPVKGRAPYNKWLHPGALIGGSAGAKGRAPQPALTLETVTSFVWEKERRGVACVNSGA